MSKQDITFLIIPILLPERSAEDASRSSHTAIQGLDQPSNNIVSCF